MVLLMVNLSLSAPVTTDQVAASLAERVATLVVFSGMDWVLFESPALPDGPVMTGGAS